VLTNPRLGVPARRRALSRAAWINNELGPGFVPANVRGHAY